MDVIQVAADIREVSLPYLKDLVAKALTSDTVIPLRPLGEVEGMGFCVVKLERALTYHKCAYHDCSIHRGERGLGLDRPR